MRRLPGYSGAMWQLARVQWSDVAATQEDGEAIIEMAREGSAGMCLLADAIEQDSKKAPEGDG